MIIHPFLYERRSRFGEILNEERSSIASLLDQGVGLIVLYDLPKKNPRRPKSGNCRSFHEREFMRQRISAKTLL